MKLFKYNIVLAIFLFFPVVLKAQSVKYVAFFPIPYVTHARIEASEAFFAGKDNGTLQVDGNFNLVNLSSDKDLILKTATTNPLSQGVGLLVGANYSGASSGDFIVDNTNSSLSISTLPASSNALKADDTLKVKAISWYYNDTQTNPIFVKGSTTPSNSYVSSAAAPSNAGKFCWSPLRIKGSYHYRYYLIAVPSSTACPN